MIRERPFRKFLLSMSPLFFFRDPSALKVRRTGQLTGFLGDADMGEPFAVGEAAFKRRANVDGYYSAWYVTVGEAF